eukprot:COSAG03_NODE_3183_length_2156_cov_2.234808_1_plen_210_part_00
MDLPSEVKSTAPPSTTAGHCRSPTPCSSSSAFTRRSSQVPDSHTYSQRARAVSRACGSRRSVVPGGRDAFQFHMFAPGIGTALVEVPGYIQSCRGRARAGVARRACPAPHACCLLALATECPTERQCARARMMARPRATWPGGDDGRRSRPWQGAAPDGVAAQSVRRAGARGEGDSYKGGKAVTVAGGQVGEGKQTGDREALRERPVIF